MVLGDGGVRQRDGAAALVEDPAAVDGRRVTEDLAAVDGRLVVVVEAAAVRGRVVGEGDAVQRGVAVVVETAALVGGPVEPERGAADCRRAFDGHAAAELGLVLVKAATGDYRGSVIELARADGMASHNRLDSAHDVDAAAAGVRGVAGEVAVQDRGGVLDIHGAAVDSAVAGEGTPGDRGAVYLGRVDECVERPELLEAGGNRAAIIGLVPLEDRALHGHSAQVVDGAAVEVGGIAAHCPAGHRDIAVFVIDG